MLFRYSNGSPFARKPAIAAHLLGLVDKMKWVDHASDKENTTRHAHPLHKVPMLILDDGSQIYDSPVIMEYFDELAGGGKLFPASGDGRYKALARLALADGIAEAAVLIMYEGRYHEGEQVSQVWIDHQTGKVERTMDHFNQNIPTTFDGAAIGLFCAVTFADRVKCVPDWRQRFPALASWFDTVRANEPAIKATEP
jgi:glutathione S-transferase